MSGKSSLNTNGEPSRSDRYFAIKHLIGKRSIMHTGRVLYREGCSDAWVAQTTGSPLRLVRQCRRAEFGNLRRVPKAGQLQEMKETIERLERRVTGLEGQYALLLEYHEDCAKAQNRIEERQKRNEPGAIRRNNVLFLRTPN